MNRILFILKYQETPTPTETYAAGRCSGLTNSVRFVADMLHNSGVEVNILQVVDNNDIDRAVSLYQPTHVIIEALWVVPEKFAELTRLHPTVNWVIHLHSEVPFLSNEGIAMGWLNGYMKHPKVLVAANSLCAYRDCVTALSAVNPMNRDRVIYLPNYYPVQTLPRTGKQESGYLDIACFGAIRPLKNHLIQAVAAIQFAEEEGRTLRFHINASRVEQQGENNLKNIRALFEHTRHQLIEHEWLPHNELLTLLSSMDASMAVSFTESFNIVAADSVATDTPLVCSPEIRWASRWSKSSPTSSEDIVSALRRVTSRSLGNVLRKHNRLKLQRYSSQAKEHWLRTFGC